MNDLITFLTSVKNKTGLIAKLLALLVGLNILLPAYVDASAMVWVNVVASILLLAFKIFASSGELPKGWTLWFYVVNFCLFILGGVDIVNAAHPIDPIVLAKITAAINGVYAIAATLNQVPVTATPQT